MKQLRKPRHIGIRDAKARLSELVRDISHGTEWTITERGVAVAKLVALTQESSTLEQRIDGLVRRGILRLPNHAQKPFPRAQAIPSGLAQAFLAEDRSGTTHTP